MKRCSRCEETKPLEVFGGCKRSKDGFRAWCRGCWNAYQREHYARNAEQERARATGYYYRNLDQARAKARRTSLNAINTYPERQKARKHARRAAGSFTAEEWLALLKASGGRCHWCEEPIEGAPHADHVVPLSRGGAGTIDNVVVSCASCNLSKGAKLVEEWRPELQSDAARFDRPI